MRNTLIGILSCLPAAILLVLNLIGVYILHTDSVDPHNALHTFILRDVPQLFNWTR